MPEQVGDTYVNLGLKKSDFDAGLKRAKSSLRDYERETLTVGRALKAGFAALVSSGVVMGIKGVSDAYAQQAKYEHMLAAAMKERGVYSDAALKHNLEYATSLQRITTFGDEEIMLAQRLFTAYSIEGEMLDKLTRATLDLAAAKEMDLKGAADLVAKSVGSSTNALARYGITVEGAVGSTERMQSAVDNISKLYSGSAQAAAENYHGQIIQLTNAWGDLNETLGAFIAGPGGKYIDWLKEAIVRTDDYLKSLGGGQIEEIKQQIRDAEHTLSEIGRVKWKGGVEGWLWRFLFGDQDEAAVRERIAELKSMLAELESKAGALSILEARRASAGSAGAVNAGVADPAAEKMFAQAAGRRQRDAELDYQLWLDERERMEEESARRIARDEEMFEQHARRRREDVLLDEYTAYESWADDMKSKTEDMSDAMKTAITGWGSHFSQQLNDAVWDADVSFASIAESFGRMITEMAIQKAIVEPLLNSITEGGGLGFLDKLFSGGGGGPAHIEAGGPAHIGAGGTTAFKMASGGTISEPIWGIGMSGRRYLFGEGGEAEEVIPHSRLRSLGGSSRTDVHHHYDITIVAADSRSIADMMRRNPAAVIGPLREALRTGDQGLVGDLRGVM